MIKFFCDKCGVEIDRENQFEHKEFEVAGHAVYLSWEEPVTDQDAICLHCVLDEVNKIDNRPKAG